MKIEVKNGQAFAHFSWIEVYHGASAGVRRRYCASCRRPRMLPGAAAQEQYPLEQYPCRRCAKEGLPHLVDNGSEFYWEHQHEAPGSSARSCCSRFGTDELRGKPREGTAVSQFASRKPEGT